MTRSTWFGIRLPVRFIPQTVTGGFKGRVNYFAVSRREKGRVA